MKYYQLYKITLQISFVIVLIALAISCLSSKKEQAPMGTATDVNEAAIDDMDKETDAQFLVKATEINLAEIRLGNLAQQIGSTKSVRDLGKMMEAEHIKALEEITELAKTKTVTIPSTTSFDAEDAYNKLKVKSSIDFDKAYADMMVKGHQDAVALFENTCNDSQDTDVREWATKMLPGLKMHLEHALATLKEVKK